MPAIFLDSCVWGGALPVLNDLGHDAVWSGAWPQDPGDPKEENEPQINADGR